MLNTPEAPTYRSGKDSVAPEGGRGAEAARAAALQFLDLVSGWHASIGKAVLENWGFAGELAEAIGQQCETVRERRRGQEVDLLDVLIAANHLAGFLEVAAPRKIGVKGIPALAAMNLSEQALSEILLHAEYQLGSLQDSLGC